MHVADDTHVVIPYIGASTLTTCITLLQRMSMQQTCTEQLTCLNDVRAMVGAIIQNTVMSRIAHARVQDDGVDVGGDDDEVSTHHMHVDATTCAINITKQHHRASHMLSPVHVAMSTSG